MGRPLTAPTATPAPPTLPQPGAGGLGIASVEAAPIGNGGGTSFSIDLPISPGRGYAPRLALASGGGNGVFGWGWDAGPPSIRRRFDHGFPNYDRNDEFIGPDGEVMSYTGSLSSVSGTPARYTALQYMPRKEGAFSRIVYMQAPDTQANDFWQVSMADGEILWFGRTADARIQDPADTTRTAAWLLHESVTPDGQHIYYKYSPGPDAKQSSRYLTAIHYGNTTCAQQPFLSNTDATQGPDHQGWLFTLLFDYSQPTPAWQVPASYDAIAAQSWVRRQDHHVDYGYGYAVPAEYLCRQVLMYHRIDNDKQLSDKGTPTLVSRLWLDYEELPSAARLMGTQRMAYETDGAWRFLPLVDIEWTPDFAAPADASCWTALAQPMALPIDGDTPESDPILYSETDLYSEGMAGLLHRIGNCWYYRRPVRDQRKGATPRAITYGPRNLLGSVPVISGAADNLLMDINGDGSLESLKTGAGGPRGYHAMQADQTWSAFVPVQTLPTEIGAPYARFGNMHGSGLPDLFVLSPTSVRYYTNQSTDTTVAFSAPREVAQAGGIVLPMPGRNPREWVNFADVLGSGQPQLVRVRHDSLTYWPWLGNGRFGAAVTMTAALPFDATSFDPGRVYFLSLFGQQAPDLVYADVDGIRIHQNLCGNGYASTPAIIPYPAGFHLGNLASIQFSDSAGTGGTSIVLTQPYGDVTPPQGYPGSGATRYWRLDLNATPPYQLAALDNNAGARTEVTWRNSIQDWVDEKVETRNGAPTHRPGARMLVDSIAQVDQVTNLQRVSTPKYRDGVWDGRERESRGFRYTEIRQETWTWSMATPAPTATRVSALAPSVTKTWFHAGRVTDDTLKSSTGSPYFYGMPYSDASAYANLATRYTQYTATTTVQAPWHDTVATPGVEQLWWQARALAGSTLRVETYGASDVPLSIQHMRWQSRAVRDLSPTLPYAIVLPMALETITYNYEGYATDPLVTQTLEMDADQYGYATWRVDVAYPRWLTATSANPYVDTGLDASLRIPFPVAGNGASAVTGLSWTSTFDDQQTVLRLAESRFQAQHLDGSDYRLGALAVERQNVLTYDTYAAAKPGGPGLHVETLSALGDPTCLLAPGQTRTLQAQTRYQYNSELPGPLVLLTCKYTALMTNADHAFLTGNGLGASEITAAGYTSENLLLTVPGGAPETDRIHAGQFDINFYNDDTGFWRLNLYFPSFLEGADGKYPSTTYSWDSQYVLVTAATDVYGNVVTARTIDYRFLAPTTLLDPNMNKLQVQFDALGRVIATSFSGTQLKANDDGSVAIEQVGFDDLETTPYDGNFDGTGPQNQASRVDYQANNMTGWYATVSSNFNLSATVTDNLASAHYLFLTGAATDKSTYAFLRSRGRALAASDATTADVADLGDPDDTSPYLMFLKSFALPSAQPALYAIQAADAFSTTAAPLSASAQNLPMTTTYVDGRDRTLCTFLRVPGGNPVYLCSQFGQISLPLGTPGVVHAVRDYTRHAPAGEVLTQWPAFFCSPFLSNASATLARTQFPSYDTMSSWNANFPSDQYLHDALGRPTRVITGRVSDRTGQAYERRTYHAPWFTLEQDENDIDDELPDTSTPPASVVRSLVSRMTKRRSKTRRR
ncbi:SpvB/TcaC N-terminal domain-containing protein [Achromobacter aloeverae]|uniref:Toxin n=1 Tax=Achromobacter aloeverae TaxID=1750518 RepID=A0A4Q1HRA5_9BURK|nr:SpvB/TcaC N-terminal domain-containing protein [Achromobacter aloeverae]RXN93123.1 hypothetical protein C7R54_05270 [Achromobacter aloeverae]